MAGMCRAGAQPGLQLSEHEDRQGFNSSFPASLRTGITRGRGIWPPSTVRHLPICPVATVPPLRHSADDVTVVVVVTYVFTVVVVAVVL